MTTRVQPKLRAIAIAALALVSLGSSARAHVVIDSPNGGEVLTPGQVYTVEWHIAIAHNLQNWDLWYSTSGAGGPWIPIATDYQAGSPLVGVPHTFQWTVPNTPSSLVRVRARMDNSGTDYFDISDGDLTILPACPAPANYCTTSPNSVGAGAVISTTGSSSLGANDFGLVAPNCPVNKPGLFFTGPSQNSSPLGNGTLCIAGTIQRFGVLFSDGGGTYAMAVDFNALPGSLAFNPGDVANFQCWYRDVAGGGAGFNLSDAVQVTFCN